MGIESVFKDEPETQTLTHNLIDSKISTYTVHKDGEVQQFVVVTGFQKGKQMVKKQGSDKNES